MQKPRLIVSGDSAEINNVKIGGTDTENYITTVQPADLIFDLSAGRKVLINDNFSKLVFPRLLVVLMHQQSQLD